MSQHYFSESPTGETRFREIEVDLAGNSYRLLTAGGVFSPDQLDRGTEVLLSKLADQPPAIPESPFLDIGCGWGAIALTAALETPEREVWAIDVNARARELARENAARLGLSNIRVVSPDELPESLAVGEIRSNPPIRVGKSELHAILAAHLPRLAPGGRAYLVVAKHLGAESLQRWIDDSFGTFSVDRFARAKGFHVIRVVRS